MCALIKESANTFFFLGFISFQSRWISNDLFSSKSFTQRTFLTGYLDTSKLNMSLQQPVREAAKQLVGVLEKFPAERIRHIVSFKSSQIERFKRVAGLSGTDGWNESKKASIDEIKDIISRTSAPLGLQKDLLKKMQAAIPEDNLSEQSIKEQIRALNTLMSNKYKTYYDVGDKLYKPAGRPNYYQRILDEVQGKQKETFFSAFRTVVFGK